MRDLVDTATWEDELTGLGPEEGDPADGEEISIIGDKLASRTRYLYEGLQGLSAAVDGVWLLVEQKSTVVTTVDTIATLSSSSFISVTSALTGLVTLVDGDIVEAYTEAHVKCTGESHVLLADRAFGTTMSSERWTGDIGETSTIQHIAYTSSWTVGPSEAGSPATVITRARLNSVVSGTYEVWSPTRRSLKVWRKVTL